LIDRIAIEKMRAGVEGSIENFFPEIDLRLEMILIGLMIF